MASPAFGRCKGDVKMGFPSDEDIDREKHETGFDINSLPLDEPLLLRDQFPFLQPNRYKQPRNPIVYIFYLVVVFLFFALFGYYMNHGRPLPLRTSTRAPAKYNAAVKPDFSINEEGKKIASAVPANEITVYITRYGKRYHRYGCFHLQKSCRPISLKNAREHYAPCLDCNPPR